MFRETCVPVVEVAVEGGARAIFGANVQTHGRFRSRDAEFGRICVTRDLSMTARSEEGFTFFLGQRYI